MDEEVPMSISSKMIASVPFVSATSFAIMTMACIMPAPLSPVFNIPLMDPIDTVTPALWERTCGELKVTIHSSLHAVGGEGD